MSEGNGKSDKFAQHAAAVARELYGEANKKLSTAKDLRFGTQGSMSVDPETGRFYSHEDKQGGGVLWAIERETGQGGSEAVDWMRQHGFYVEDDRAPPPSGGTSGGPRFDPDGNFLPPRVPDHGRQTAVYDYREPDGTLRYQVVRFDWDCPVEENPKGHDKTFCQRRPNPKKRNGFEWNLKGVEALPYRLPDLIEAIAEDTTVFVVEGEKKADALWSMGVPATCNNGGAGKFSEALVEHFKDARVVILPDNDDAGREHIKTVGNKLTGVAREIRVLNLPDLGPKEDVVDWIEAGGTAEALFDLVETRARTFEATPYESKFGAVFWQDVDNAGPAYESLIKNVLSRCELSMVAGPSGSGKTFLALELAMSVARGLPFFEHRARKGLVLYQAGEAATGVRRKRLPAYRRHHDCAQENVPFVLLENKVDLYSSEDDTDALIEEARALGRYFNEPLELIVIDTFSKATTGINENDGGDVGRVLERCDRIRKATGAHVMLVHHMNAEGARPRGHTSLFANIETVITVRTEEDRHDKDGRAIHTWEIKKQKEGEAGKVYSFVLPKVETGRFDEDNEPETSCIVSPPSSEPNQTLPKSAIDVGGKTAVVLRAIYETLEESGEPAPAAMQLPRGTRIVDRKAIGEKLDASDPIDIPDDASEDDTARAKETRRKAHQRARDTLYKRGIIKVQDPWVWLTGKPVKGFGPPPGTPPPIRRKPDEPPPPDDLPFDVSDDDINRM